MPALKTADYSTIQGSDYEGPAAIYVHWPFCLKRCPYCDFNSHVREQVSHQDWQTALVKEIDSFANLFPNLKAKSIFFGGGTPSLMEPETVAAVVDKINKVWGSSNEIEITLEANPSSVEADRFRAYKQAGINRLSVGIQSLNNDVLKFLGRLHSAEEALNALKVAQNNFDRVSFDIIYARPDQTVKGWQEELREALSFGTSHMSLYQLTIEEGTAFYHQFHRGKFQLPDEETSTQLFEETQNLMEAAGMPAYETSNHAKPGQESQHNLAYWQGDYYIGIGPGAHGRLPSNTRGSAQAHAQTKRPEDWLAAVDKNGLAIETTEFIEPKDRAIEAIMTGLRLTKGVELDRWQQRFGQKIEAVIDMENLNHLQQSGHISLKGDTLALTAEGKPLLNFILGKLLA